MSNMNRFLFAVVVSCCVISLFGQYPSYEGCADLTHDDFKLEILIAKTSTPTLLEPLRIAFDPDTLGNVNFYFLERGGGIRDSAQGKVKYYNAVDKSISLVGEFTVFTKCEHGMIGMAVDPDFQNTRWLYLMYNPAEAAVYRLARYTIDADNTIDYDSGKIIMEFIDERQFPTADDNHGCFHTGGDLFFDPKGDLWITVGENRTVQGFPVPSAYLSRTDSLASAEDGVSDTYSFKGSVLRIHPEADGSYTIPEGNFGEYFGDLYEEEGNMSRAAEFRDQSKVKPEIYAKGFRNPYTVSVDPVTGWAGIADCGAECRNKRLLEPFCPDDGMAERHHLMTAPGFYGWPYFHGDNFPFADEGQAKDPMAPLNDSPFNKGIKVLPPAIPGAYVYQQSCATVSTFYRYDGTLQSDVKLPPHFDGIWLVGDWNLSWIKAIELDDQGGVVSVSSNLFTTLNGIDHPLHFRQGPDGALYIVNYSCSLRYNSDQCTNIARIIYTGDCRPVNVAPGPDGIKNVAGDISVQRENLLVHMPDVRTVSVYTVSGNRIRTFSSRENGVYSLSGLPALGVYVVKAETGERTVLKKVFISAL